MSLPARLFKYEPFTVRTLLNIKGQILYFGPPSGFNDPYDCATPSIKKPSDEHVHEWLREYHASRTFTEDEREAAKRTSIDQVRESMWTSGVKVFNELLKNFVKERGIACFSEKNDDLLMWSHYGDRYRGVCLEFDTSVEPFSRAKPVRYVTDFPQLALKEVMSGAPSEIQDVFWTKSVSWQYEKEWRALHNVAGMQYIYPAEALTGVYFGPDIDPQSREIVCLILGGQHDKVRFYKGQRSSSEFRVTFDEFTYHSYLQAKKQGLRG